MDDEFVNFLVQCLDIGVGRGGKRGRIDHVKFGERRAGFDFDQELLAVQGECRFEAVIANFDLGGGMQKPEDFNRLFGFKFVGEGDGGTVDKFEGALDPSGMIGVGFAQIDTGDGTVGRGFEVCDGGDCTGVLIGPFCRIQDEGVVAFGSDSVKFPALAVVLVAQVGLAFGAAVEDEAFAEGFENEGAQVEVTLSATRKYLSRGRAFGSKSLPLSSNQSRSSTLPC